MKKLLFLFLSLFLVYIAGMYRYPALMVLAVGQLLLLGLVTVQVHVRKSRLNVRFLRKTATAIKKSPFSCEVAIEAMDEVTKRGFFVTKLPIGNLRFILTHGNGKDVLREKFYGSAREGKVIFATSMAYCGIETFTLEKVQVYDYFYLGCAGKRILDQMQVVVFPQEIALNIQTEMSGQTEHFGKVRREDFSNGSGDEIRQIRKYREGDQRRQFHWKLSARMEDLLVKEFEREREGVAELFLDLRGYGSTSLEERDGFYEVLSAFLLGLLQKREQVQVFWKEEGKKHKRTMEITERAQCRELLMRLYKLYDLQMAEDGRHEETIDGDADQKGQKNRQKYRKKNIAPFVAFDDRRACWAGGAIWEKGQYGSCSSADGRRSYPVGNQP